MKEKPMTSAAGEVRPAYVRSFDLHEGDVHCAGAHCERVYRASDYDALKASFYDRVRVIEMQLEDKASLTQKLAEAERQLEALWLLPCIKNLKTAETERDLHAATNVRLTARLRELEAKLESEVFNRDNAIASMRTTRDEMQNNLRKSDEEVERLRNVILWALGEGDEFPERPDNWHERTYKPWYWWRIELRKRAALSPASQSREGGGM